MIKVLVIAAHPDDEVLGCGGTIARHIKKGDEVHVVILAEGVTGRDKFRDRKKRLKEIKNLSLSAKKSHKILGTKSLKLFDLPDNRMDSVNLLDIVKIVEKEVTLIRPKIIVADEPVSMVDASLRAAILDVMLKLRDEDGISFIYITHDLSTAYQVGDNIIILYKGKVVETGKATNVIDNPTHPYVKLLIDSIPVPDPDHKWTEMIDIPDEGMDFKDH